MIFSGFLTRHAWLTPCTLAVLALLCYANSFPGVFILDDLHIAKNNALFRNFDLVTLFRSDYWYGIENSGLYRPLTILSLYVNRLLLGEGPLGFHLVNVLLHTSVVVLFWKALRAWGASAVAAALAALFFAVHPIHTEVINEVVGRSELLVAFFLLAGFIAARRQGRSAGVWVCFCYLLALLSKEHAVTFLLLLPLCEAFAAGTFRIWRQRWPIYLALLAVAVVWLLWRHYGLINPLPRSRMTEAAAPLAYVDTVTRVLTALQLQWVYFSKMLLGIDLQAVYSNADLPEFIRSVFSLRGLLVSLASLAVLGLCVWGWLRHSAMALFALLYIVAFSPTANILLSIGIAMAERVAYFPSLWFCAAAGAGCAWLLSRERWRLAVWCLVIGYGVWLGGMTLLRNPEFASEVALWSAEVQNNPKDYIGWQNLAESYANLGQPAAADAAYLRMLALAPDYPGGLRSRTYFLLRNNRYEDALHTVTRAYAIAKENNDPVDMSFDGLDVAEVQMGLGNFETALVYLEATTMQPLREHMRFLELRGKCLANLGRDAEAIADLERITIDFVGSDVRYYHGQSLYRLGRIAEARKQLELGVKAKSDGPTWNLLGVVCAQLGDREAAIAAFAKAVELEPANTYYRENLQKAQRTPTLH